MRYRVRSLIGAGLRVLIGVGGLTVLGGSDCTHKPPPKCDGSCSAPSDTDDCAVCCDTEREATDCCEANFTRGTSEYSECTEAVAIRWSLAALVEPVGPSDGLGGEPRGLLGP